MGCAVLRIVPSSPRMCGLCFAPPQPGKISTSDLWVRVRQSGTGAVRAAGTGAALLNRSVHYRVFPRALHSHVTFLILILSSRCLDLDLCDLLQHTCRGRAEPSQHPCYEKGSFCYCWSAARMGTGAGTRAGQSCRDRPHVGKRLKVLVPNEPSHLIFPSPGSVGVWL